ncbi:MAG: hypothetical protein ACK44B_11225 [Flavobacteriales bacterium]
MIRAEIMVKLEMKTERLIREPGQTTHPEIVRPRLKTAQPAMEALRMRMVPAREKITTDLETVPNRAEMGRIQTRTVQVRKEAMEIRAMVPVVIMAIMVVEMATRINP